MPRIIFKSNSHREHQQLHIGFHRWGKDPRQTSFVVDIPFLFFLYVGEIYDLISPTHRFYGVQIAASSIKDFLFGEVIVENIPDPDDSCRVIKFTHRGKEYVFTSGVEIIRRPRSPNKQVREAWIGEIDGSVIAVGLGGDLTGVIDTLEELKEEMRRAHEEDFYNPQ